jgi:hypothetical protein
MPIKSLRNLLSVMILVGASGSAWAACEYPRQPDMPDGTNASKDAMIAGQKAVKAYMASMDEYLACIEEEAVAAKSEDEAPEITAQREALLNKRYNAAVAEMEEVAARFNEQVRAYKEQEG